MTSLVLAAVLLAALLHASWNAVVKSSSDTYLSTTLVAACAALLAALLLPFAAAPSPASWPFIAASSLVQLLYYELLIATYRSGDMSHAYPLMRGSAPLMVAAGSALLLGEHLGLRQWLAVSCICGAILALGLAPSGTRASRRTTVLALATAATIATYTLIDGIGVRLSGAPAAYTMWIYLLTGTGFVLWAVRQRPGQLLPYARRHLVAGLLGGAGSLGAYGIALWAMTRAPVATVAALRETSILFATLIAALVLRERISAGRFAAIGMIACGAVLMRLA